MSGDSLALKTANGLARHLMKVFSGLIPDPADWSSMIAGREHGWWAGHFHTFTGAMIGLAHSAVATGNQEAARYVPGFYEYARLHGLARIGFFNAQLGDLGTMKKHYNPEVVSKSEELTAFELEQAQSDPWGVLQGVHDEGCAAADMTYLAVLLSEHGLRIAGRTRTSTCTTTCLSTSEPTGP